MTDYDDTLAAALRAPTTAITYELNRVLRRESPGKVTLEAAGQIDVLGFARAGLAEAVVEASPANEILSGWTRATGLVDALDNGSIRLVWQGLAFDVVRVSFQVGYECKTRSWFVGDDEATTRELLTEISRWSSEVHDEILVFSDGEFRKSAKLHADIQASTWSDLVLRGASKEDILGDFEQFFAAEATYARIGTPWRRGALFLGPPGNGKSHCVKALVRALAKPAIYARGFRHRYYSTSQCIEQVFERAREISPCILVLEDLDGLFDSDGLAFFLNELDGFAENRGIVTLGTTNHPERLDPALLDRPSRFDRTYAFELPNEEDRKRYLMHQRPRLEPAGAVSDAVIAALVDETAGFSFAYLKELVTGALLAVAGGAAKNASEAMTALVPRLREQLGRARDLAAAPAVKRSPEPSAF